MKLRVLLAVVLVALSGVAGAAAWIFLRPQPWFVTAVESLPESTLRSTFTDWARVRQQVGAPAPGTHLSSTEVEKLVRKGYDLGVVEMSALQDTSVALNDLYGFTPFDLDWEIYGQSSEGAVDVLRFAEDADMSGLDDRLRDLGYTPPSSPDGVWEIDPDELTGISLDLTPIQVAVVLMPEKHLALMSANPGYAAEAAKVVSGKAPNLGDVDGTVALARLTVAPVSATLWSRDFACQDLAMSQADGGDQARADELVAAAGTVSPLSGLVMAQEANGHLTVGMWFANDDQAADNVASRRALASGDAPGQGGTFADRFSVEDAGADGRAVFLDLEPKVERSLMTDIAGGPVLFATC